MVHCKLPNYLRRYRKRARLSQEELAFLLGSGSGAKVSRYERFRRIPGLETALACEAIFGVPVRELFAGIFQKVEGNTGRRARLLARRLSARQAQPLMAEKLSRLRRFLPS